jgi:hypothetical protein
MSGGKGGTQTTKIELPEVLDRAARENLELANQVGRLGYTPYMGPTVAGLSPAQRATMANTNQAAQAFGMAQAGNPDSYMIGEAFNDGAAYGAAPIYRAGVGALTPEQHRAILSVVDPSLRSSAAMSGVDVAGLGATPDVSSPGGKGGKGASAAPQQSLAERLRLNQGSGGNDYSAAELASMYGTSSGGGGSRSYQDTYDRQMSQYTSNPGISVGYGSSASSALSDARR